MYMEIYLDIRPFPYTQGLEDTAVVVEIKGCNFRWIQRFPCLFRDTAFFTKSRLLLL